MEAISSVFTDGEGEDGFDNCAVVSSAEENAVSPSSAAAAAVVPAVSSAILLSHAVGLALHGCDMER